VVTKNTESDMRTRGELIEAVTAALQRKVEKGKRKGKRYTWRDVAEHLYPKKNPNKTAAFLNKLYNTPGYLPGVEACLEYDLHGPQLTQPCDKCGKVHKVDGLCKASTVYVVERDIVEMTADEVVKLPAPPKLIFVKPDERVKVEKPKAPRKPSRPRVRVELPADLTPDERAIIMKLTPEERRKRLLGE
jgi:hypothetical protein